VRLTIGEIGGIAIAAGMGACAERHVPVLPGVDVPPFEDQQVAGQQLLNPAE
jgi:hypothetical protein